MRTNNLLFITTLLLIFVSCKTYPPTSVDIGTGKIFLNVKIDETTGSNVTSKVVLLEDFANVSCIPCVTSNKIIESLTRYSYGPDKLVAVKFPTNFPSSADPFYLSNTEDCDARMAYYTIFFAPTTIIDGTSRPTSTDSISIKNAIDTQLSGSPRFGIEVSDSVFNENYFINASIKLIDTVGINLNDLVVHMIVTETDIAFDLPPGSNGETEFKDVMRVMLPYPEGEPIASLIQQGELSYVFEESIGVDWKLTNLNSIIYVQNSSTKEVYQAGSTFE
jgi:hypothetical protein